MYFFWEIVNIVLEQGVALTWRNTTGPPCSFGRSTANAPDRQRADRPRARRPADPTAGSVTEDDDRRQRQTTASKNTSLLGGPVLMVLISFLLHYCIVMQEMWCCKFWNMTKAEDNMH